MMKKMLLLGPGELGKGFIISAQRKDQRIITCDSYAEAPTIQVADRSEVFDTLNDEELERMVKKRRPDIIVPEIEATRTEHLYDFEKEGIQVVPSARAVNFTMNRKAIHGLATQELGLKTAKYFYARTLEELKGATDKVGFPCVVKPSMSSSGKGQSPVKSVDELGHAWEYGCSDSHDDIHELIIKKFIKFNGGTTLLTITQKNGPTLLCPPIGHVQKGGDYRESFQSVHIGPTHLKGAEEMTEGVTRALTGAGLWGVEFFLNHDNGVYLSKLPPRPHDTGMVMLAGTRNLNEFGLHLRAVLGLPIPGTKQEWIGVSAVILSPTTGQERPQYRELEETTKEEDTYLRIFGKLLTHVNHRMDVALCYAPLNSDLGALHDKVKRIAEKVEVH